MLPPTSHTLLVAFPATPPPHLHSPPPPLTPPHPPSPRNSLYTPKLHSHTPFTNSIPFLPSPRTRPYTHTVDSPPSTPQGLGARPAAARLGHRASRLAAPPATTKPGRPATTKPGRARRRCRLRRPAGHRAAGHNRGSDVWWLGRHAPAPAPAVRGGRGRWWGVRRGRRRVFG